jgi:hypothetical protein
MVRAPCLALLSCAACLEAPPGGSRDKAIDAGVVSTPDGGIDAAPAIDRSTCATILATSPDEPSGMQMIDPDGEGGEPPFPVHCDMDVVGGGWMLVARSASAPADGGFGWLFKTGAVDDDDAPYSLLAVRPGLEFTELLVGTRGDGKAWGDEIYRIENVPEGFVTSHVATALAVDPDQVRGDCPADTTPAMLQYIGHTDAAGHFFLRDMSVDQNFGLYPTGFALSDDECDASGELDGEHGMIFVR